MSRFRSPFPLSFLLVASIALGVLLAIGAVSAEKPKAPATAPVRDTAVATDTAIAPAPAPGTLDLPAPQTLSLEERASAYWKARIANQAEVARGYYVPLPSGQLPADIAEYGNIRFSSYTLESIEEQGDRGVVKVRVDASGFVKGLIGGHMTAPSELARPLLVEEWKKVDDVWRKIAPNRSLSRIGRKPKEATD